MEWISVDIEMPKALMNVLVIVNENGAKNQNQMVANFIPKFTEESGCYEWSEYCEDKDMHFIPEGWYANTTYIGDEYSSYFLEGEVTYWMPLPEQPKE